MENKEVYYIELKNGNRTLVPKSDYRLKNYCREVIEVISANDLAKWCVGQRSCNPKLSDILGLRFNIFPDPEVCCYVYGIKGRSSAESLFKVECAKIFLRGKWIIKEMSHAPERLDDGRYKYPWRRCARRTYCWAIPAEDYFEIDTGSRIEWKSPDIFESKKDALIDLFGYKKTINPKDGDVLARGNGDVIIYKECPDNPDGKAYFYAIMHKDGDIFANIGLVRVNSSHIDKYRYATGEEREILFKKLNDNGFSYDLGKITRRVTITGESNRR